MIANLLPRVSLALEAFILFIAVPVVLFFFATHWGIALVLWLGSAYAAWRLDRDPQLSWRDLWYGTGWTASHRKIALLRFSMVLLIFLIAIWHFFSHQFLSLPLHRPVLWVTIMVLYPLLSVLPQEFVFRSFFFRRYEALFPNSSFMVVMSGLSFGLTHIIFHNWVAPVLCVLGGIMFAHSYRQHHSLKWAVIEHTAYGSMVFTLGIGFYFYLGGTPP